MSDDAELVRAVRAGEAGSFERLVRSHQRLVWHVVQRLVRNTEDSRELCQETFLRVHRTLHQYRGESRLGTWIARVAYHLALRHLQRRRIELVAHDDPDDAGDSPLDQAADAFDLEDSVAQAQRQRFLHSAIEGLAPLPRLVLTLYHLEELPIAEIAQITGLPAGSIKSHLFRSREQLRRQLLARGWSDPR